MKYKKTSIIETLNDLGIYLTINQINTIRAEILKNNRKFTDLLIWGEFYIDENGDRIDPLTINKTNDGAIENT